MRSNARRRRRAKRKRPRSSSSAIDRFLNYHLSSHSATLTFLCLFESVSIVPKLTPNLLAHIYIVLLRPHLMRAPSILILRTWYRFQPISKAHPPFCPLLVYLFLFIGHSTICLEKMWKSYGVPYPKRLFSPARRFQASRIPFQARKVTR